MHNAAAPVLCAVVPPDGHIMSLDDPKALEPLNYGDIAWMLASTAVVLLMTPGGHL
jgi:hypothetical protein